MRKTFHLNQVLPPTVEGRMADTPLGRRLRLTTEHPEILATWLRVMAAQVDRYITERNNAK